jgi:beta-glucosidase
MPFPSDFVWGSATASYQIEGAVDEDGRGTSIWDTFSHTPGKVDNGDTGDVACDHYHRWADDVELMVRYGLNAYRFSVAWPRVQPNGRGAPNEKGLDFYRRLVDRLRERGIRPAATLYHWDLPQALQDDGGGWQNRDIAERFAEYSAIVYGALGDGVEWWITHNEPWVVAAIGHREGRHAPGLTDVVAELKAAHHLLLSHGRSVEAYRATGLAAPIGITLSLSPTYPESDVESDRGAAALSDAYANRWYLDPVFRGEYPAELFALFADRYGRDWVREGDVARVKQPIDFLGVNYYMRTIVRAPTAADDAQFPWIGTSQVDPDVPRSSLGWEMTPNTFTDLLVRLAADYGSPPIFVTENGCALDDVIGPDGEVHDPRRVEFYRGHLAAVEEAIGRGVDVRGYFAWSLMDNFEWGYGYRPRFGITYVDYPTQRRIPKDSARWYAEVVRRNRLG